MSKKKSINQVGNLNQIIHTYPSIAAAAKATKINKSNITRCLTLPSKHTLAGNFKWEYADVVSVEQPSIWLFSFEELEEALIEQVSINHNHILKFLIKYLYLIHLLIANKGKLKTINAEKFSDIVCYRNFDKILQTLINLGVVRKINGVEVTDVLDVNGNCKRISCSYGLTAEYQKKSFIKRYFNATDGKMIKKLIARNEAKDGVTTTIKKVDSANLPLVNEGMREALPLILTPSCAIAPASQMEMITEPVTVDVFLNDVGIINEGIANMELLCVEPLKPFKFEIYDPQQDHNPSQNDLSAPWLKKDRVLTHIPSEQDQSLVVDMDDFIPASAAKVAAFKLLSDMTKEITMSFYTRKEGKIGILKSKLCQWGRQSGEDIMETYSFIDAFVEELMAIPEVKHNMTLSA